MENSRRRTDELRGRTKRNQEAVGLLELVGEEVSLLEGIAGAESHRFAACIL